MALPSYQGWSTQLTTATRAPEQLSACQPTHLTSQLLLRQSTHVTGQPLVRRSTQLTSRPINYSPGHWKMTDSIDRPATSVPVNPVDWPATSGLTQLTGQPINYSTGQSKTTDSQGTFHLSRSLPQHRNLHTGVGISTRALESPLSGSCASHLYPHHTVMSRAGPQLI